MRSGNRPVWGCISEVLLVSVCVGSRSCSTSCPSFLFFFFPLSDCNENQWEISCHTARSSSRLASTILHATPVDSHVRQRRDGSKGGAAACHCTFHGPWHSPVLARVHQRRRAAGAEPVWWVPMPFRGSSSNARQRTALDTFLHAPQNPRTSVARVLPRNSHAEDNLAGPPVRQQQQQQHGAAAGLQRAGDPPPRPRPPVSAPTHPQRALLGLRGLAWRLLQVPSVVLSTGLGLAFTGITLGFGVAAVVGDRILPARVMTGLRGALLTHTTGCIVSSRDTSMTAASWAPAKRITPLCL